MRVTMQGPKNLFCQPPIGKLTALCPGHQYRSGKASFGNVHKNNGPVSRRFDANASNGDREDMNRPVTRLCADPLAKDEALIPLMRSGWPGSPGGPPPISTKATGDNADVRLLAATRGLAIPATEFCTAQSLGTSNARPSIPTVRKIWWCDGAALDGCVMTDDNPAPPAMAPRLATDAHEMIRPLNTRQP